MSSIQTTSKIIKNWIEKGDQATSNADKFICYWIALNAWYGTYLHPSYSDGRDYLIEKDYINDLKRVVKSKGGNWDTEILSAQSLNPKLKSLKLESSREVVVNNLETLIQFIYTVRNNLFHGHKEDTNERDKKVLEISTPILQKILSVVI